MSSGLGAASRWYCYEMDSIKRRRLLFYVFDDSAEVRAALLYAWGALRRKCLSKEEKRGTYLWDIIDDQADIVIHH